MVKDWDYAIFKVLKDAVPLSEEAGEVLLACINDFVHSRGLSVREVERLLAIKSLRFEGKEGETT